MKTYPILVDGKEVDTGRYISFPDMDKIVMDPGLAIALQLRYASSSQKFIISKTPGLIPGKTPENRYIKDYRKHHGMP
ncbi:MAG: hypothetical protein P1Q69_05725, partial [Candidatus Thorarchaeota archaeon]|nr:hypothetical protein [Candidatus Thorarchaeota archaeon]